MSFLRHALVTVPAVVLLGSLSGRLAGSGYGNPWFDALEKPAFMPPGWVFGAAWTLLYILLGFVLAMILHARGARGRSLVLGLFLAQLALNYAWSPLFFAFHRTVAALLVILVMVGLTAAAAALSWEIRRTAALLMLPYLAWLCFAAALTFEVVRLNPGPPSLFRAAAVPISSTKPRNEEAPMQSQNRLFDDFVKMMNGAAGTVAGMTREAEGAMRDRFRDWIGGLDMVGRDEFEAVKAIAVAAREEAQALRARIEALEAASAAPTGGRPRKSSPGSGAGKAGPAEGLA